MKGKPTLLVTVLATSALGVLCLVAALTGPRPGISAPETAAVRAAPETGTDGARPVPEPVRVEVAHADLGRGGNLTDALERLSVDGPLRTAIITEIGRHLDLRRLPAATGVTASRSADGSLTEVAVRADSDRFLRITLDGGDPPVLTARLVELAVDVDERAIEGTVRTSVAEALGEHEHGVRLTMAFADVFQWDVDLFVDPRSGDRVRLVYEDRRRGDVPNDAPRYGGRPDHHGDPLTPGRILAATYQGATARATAFWVDGGDGDGAYYDGRGRPMRKTFLKSPLNYRRISSGFSNARRNPVTHKVVPHHGVDFAADPGTPVVATADGKVVGAGWKGALGRAVRIRHGSEYETVYGHLRGIARGVRVGARIRQNQVIGYVGSTGRATGPHLHYAMLRRGSAINPLRFENPPAEPLDASLIPVLEAARARWEPLLEPDGFPDVPAELASGASVSNPV